MARSFQPQQFTEYTDLKRPSVGVWFAKALVASLLITLPLAMLPKNEPSPQTYEFFIGLGAFLAVMGIPAVLGIAWFMNSRNFTVKKEQALLVTLSRIGLEVGTYPKIRDYPVVPSSIIHNLGENSTLQYPRYLTLNGELDGLPIECVFLDARAYTFYLYLHIGLPDSYPHTIVDGRDSFMQHDLPTKIGSIERIQPEGNLHKYFSIFANKSKGSEALYTLTPDVLESILDYGTAYNIEVIGNSLYIFTRPDQIETAEGFANIFNLAESLINEFQQRAKSRGIKPGEFRYNSEYAKQRMDIHSVLAQASRGGSEK